MLRGCFSSCFKDDTVQAPASPPATSHDVQPVAPVVEPNDRNTAAFTAQFCEGGPEYNITITCLPREGDWSPFWRDRVLSVFLDDRRVILVDNLTYKFRGNETISADGTTVDVTWDLNDLLFSGPRHYATFVFRPKQLGENTTIGLCPEADMGTGFTHQIEAFDPPTRVHVW